MNKICFSGKLGFYLEFSGKLGFCPELWNGGNVPYDDLGLMCEK